MLWFRPVPPVSAHWVCFHRTLSPSDVEERRETRAVWRFGCQLTNFGDLGVIILLIGRAKAAGCQPRGRSRVDQSSRQIGRLSLI